MSYLKKYSSKAINLGVVSGILLSSSPIAAIAGGLDDLVMNPISNFTRAQTTTEDLGNGKKINNYYTGGFSFTFNTSYPPPIFAVSPPSIQAGCNGISIKGMFVSIINLDQFASMLQNAGASAAWGVAIGIIYSLPGVASVFKMINQWAKDLQALIANVCQNGIMMGQAFAKKYMHTDEMKKTILNSIGSHVPDCMQNGENCAASAIGLGEKFTKDGVWKGSSSIPAMSNTDKSDAVLKLFSGILDNDPSFGGRILFNVLKMIPSKDQIYSLLGPKKDTNEPLTVNTFSLGLNVNGKFSLGEDLQGIGNNSFGGSHTIMISQITKMIPDLANRRRAGMALFMYILIYNSVGDLSLKNSDKIMNNPLLNKINDPKEGQKSLEVLLNKNHFGSGSVVLVGSPVDMGKAENIANFLVNGVKTNENPFELTFPRFNFIYAKEEKNPDYSAIAILSDKSPGGIAIIHKFVGIKEGAKCAVYKELEKSNIITDDELKNSCPYDTDFGLLVPGIDKFLSIIKNTPSSEQGPLIDALVGFNQVSIAREYMNILGQSLAFAQDHNKLVLPDNKASNRTGLTEPGTDNAIVNAKEQYIQKLLDFQKAMKKELTKVITDTKVQSYSGMTQIFDNQAKKNKERGIKNMMQ